MLTSSHKANLEAMLPANRQNPMNVILRNKKKAFTVALLGIIFFYYTYDKQGTSIICNCYTKKEANDLLLKMFKKYAYELNRKEMKQFNRCIEFCCRNAPLKKLCLEQPELSMKLSEYLLEAFDSVKDVLIDLNL